MNKKIFALYKHIRRRRVIALPYVLFMLLPTMLSAQTVLSMPPKDITATQTVATPFLTLSTRMLYVTSTGGSNSITVTSNISWTASSSVKWITVSPSSGENNGTLNISTEANTEHIARSAIISVHGSGITSKILVTQSPAPIFPPSLTLSAYTLNVAATGGSNNITVTSNIDWTASCDATWLTVSPASGVNNDTLRISVSANTGNRSRTAFIMVNGDNIMRTITVTQGIEPELMLSSYTLNVAASSISKNVTVTSNIGWTASCDACWLTISPATGTNNGTLKITTAVNTTNSARTAFVMISGNGITCMIIVTQAATPTANAIVDAASVTYANNVLTVNTPQTEQVNVYAMSGVWVYGARKNTGTTTFDLSRLPDGVYIVTGESGWRKKVIKN